MSNINKIKQLPKTIRIFLRSLLIQVKKSFKVFTAFLKNRPEAIKKWWQLQVKLLKENRKNKRYRSFRLQKRIKPEPRYIPSTGSLLKSTFGFIWKHKRVFFGILFIHAVVYLAVLRVPVDTDLNTIKQSVNSVLGDNGDKTTQGLTTTLGSVLESSSANQTNQVSLAIATFFMSLVYIWAIRVLHTNEKIKVRDAYYQASTPLVPSLMIFAVGIVQILPFAIASFLYSTARSGGFFVTGFEDLGFFTVVILTGLLSLYWLTSTIMAFYIVTLPGMYPVNALKSARKVVQFRRFRVFRRILSLPVVLAIAYLALLLIIIRFSFGQVFLVIEVVQLCILPIVHVYLYKLYRALL